MGIVHLADVYQFGGYTFEFHRYCGPMLCKKDMEPRERQPGARSKFWPVFEKWQGLDKEQQEETRIYG